MQLPITKLWYVITLPSLLLFGILESLDIDLLSVELKLFFIEGKKKLQVHINFIKINNPSHNFININNIRIVAFYFLPYLGFLPSFFSVEQIEYPSLFLKP